MSVENNIINNAKYPLRNALALISYLIISTLLLLPQTSNALEGDRAQPIEVSANQATLDDKKNLAIYEGDVVLTQGSLIIKADKLTIKAAKNGQVDEVTATGNLAEFTQTPEPNKDPVVAKAEHINYLVAKETIVLTRSASVVQNKNLFQGNVITYDIKQQKLSASGPSETQTPGQPSGRVTMILPPPTPPAEQVTEESVEEPLSKQTTEKATETNEQTDSVSPSKKLQE